MAKNITKFLSLVLSKSFMQMMVSHQGSLSIHFIYTHTKFFC